MSNAFSALFGKPPKPAMRVIEPTNVNANNAEWKKQEVLKKYAKLQRATMLSNLTQPSIGRKTLGAG